MIAGIQVRAARALLGLSANELGELAGISPNTISRFENGAVAMSNTILAIRQALESQGIAFVGDEMSDELGVLLKRKRIKEQPSSPK